MGGEITLSCVFRRLLFFCKAANKAGEHCSHLQILKQKIVFYLVVSYGLYGCLMKILNVS